MYKGKFRTLTNKEKVFVAMELLTTPSHLKQTKYVDTPCWVWDGKIPNKYGALSDSKFIGLHRFAYIFFKKEIPEGLQVQHLCNNPPCWRPDHLVLGTPQENSKYIRVCGRK